MASIISTFDAVDALAITKAGEDDIRSSRLGEWAPPRLIASPSSSPKSSQASSAEAQSSPPDSIHTSEKLPSREATLSGFLEEIALVSDVDKYDESADAVVLMTIHAAKGLEFPVVFLAGMEDGIFPSQQNLGEAEQMSEERRLMYVAVTRAKEMLYITHTKSRLMYGRTGCNPLSLFVRDELPESLTYRDGPRKIPPRSTVGYTPAKKQYNNESVFREFNRPADIFSPRKKSCSESWGVERIAPGTRVSHAMFGAGTVLSAKDMGGDVLYEVNFDSGVTKKLMATFAKLKKI